MSALSTAGQDWEQIVELARHIDHGVASRLGIEDAEVLRLARAVLDFERRRSTGSVVTDEPAVAAAPESAREP